MERVKTYLLNCRYANIIPRVSIENETYAHKKSKINDIDAVTAIINLSM